MLQKVDYGRADTENRNGRVTGLAWTEVGGDLLTIETAAVRGNSPTPVVHWVKWDAGIYPCSVNRELCPTDKLDQQ